MEKAGYHAKKIQAQNGLAVIYQVGQV